MGNPDMPTPDFIVDKLCETARSARAPLFGFARHQGPAQGPCRLLQAPLRRRSESRQGSDRGAGLQGRLRQSRHGDHRPRRCRAGAQSRLSHPRFRLHDRRAPPSATSPPRRRKSIFPRSASRRAIRSPSPAGDGGELSSNPTAQVVDLDFYKEVIKFARKHEIWVLSTSPMPTSISTTTSRRRPSLQVRWRQGYRHRIPVLVQDLLDARLAHGFRGRQ